jgi:hypothetical protein
MARKKLLSEGEVRQFMKLANLGPLSENYFSNNPLEEEGLEDELEATEDELGTEDHFADEESDELGALDAEGGDEGNEALLARVVQAVAAELGVEVDVEGADAEGGEELEVGAELEEPSPDGAELEFGAEEEELPGNMDMYQEEREIEEGGSMVGDMSRQATRKGATQRAAPPRDPSSACRPGEHWNAELKQCDPGEEKSGALDQDAIVAEVARRVAARLSTAKKKEVLADQLAERIFERLTAK